MITVTGIIESTSGVLLGRRVIFKSQSTPQANSGGLVTTPTTRKILSNPTTGQFSIQLRPGNYAVTYETKPDATNFNIAIPSNLDGTTVSIDQLIVTSFATLPAQAPYLVWNGVRAGHITFDPIANAGSPTLAEVAYTGGHIQAQTYSYAISYLTPEGETKLTPAVSIGGSGAADKAIRVSMAVNPARVTTKRIWRNKTNGGTTLYLLAEVSPGAPSYDDWESHADFTARAPANVAPTLNTTAGVIYANATTQSLYFSIDGLRFLSDIVGDVTIQPGYKLNVGKKSSDIFPSNFCYLQATDFHYVSDGPTDSTIWSLSYTSVPVITLSASLDYPVGTLATGNVLTRQASGLAAWQALPTIPAQMVFTGSADPEGNQVAPVGAVYNKIVGGNFLAQFIKASGSGNTGWQ